MIPKGKLLIIGGAEDKADESPDIKEKNRDFIANELLEELIPKKIRARHTVEVITTASTDPAEYIKAYRKTLKALGYSRVGFISITTREEAHDSKLVERIEKAKAVLMTGGDQFRLSSILGSSPLVKAIGDKFKSDKDFVLAGTSAGAMVMSRTMLHRGENNEAMLKGDVHTAAGFGFIECCIVDTHFIERGRFGRLAQAVIANPVCIGVGLGEDTGLVIKKGNEATCYGSGMVIVIDPTEVKYTNIAYAEENTPINVEGLKVHIMVHGDRFVLSERQFIAKENKPGKEKQARTDAEEDTTRQGNSSGGHAEKDKQKKGHKNKGR